VWAPTWAAWRAFEDDRAFETVYVTKSESRETTFDRDLRGLAALEPQLRRLTEQLCSTLVRGERRGRTGLVWPPGPRSPASAAALGPPRSCDVVTPVRLG
jgi:nucleotidyltransferase/DNA polymerase involved in DNA repair